MSNMHTKNKINRPAFLQHRPAAMQHHTAAAYGGVESSAQGVWMKTDYTADQLGDQSTDAGSGHSSPRFESPESQFKAAQRQQQSSPGAILRESLRTQGNTFLDLQAQCNQQAADAKNHMQQKYLQQWLRPRANKERPMPPPAEGCYAAASMRRPEDDVRHMSRLSISELLKLSYPEVVPPRSLKPVVPPRLPQAYLPYNFESVAGLGMLPPATSFIRLPPGLEQSEELVVTLLHL